jgi:hypothetical protein
MPNPFYRGQRCGAREMEEIDRARYTEVRAAGWAFDREAGVWRHEHTGRTGLNQHVIYECLRNHDAMPPCGNRRDETGREAIRDWVTRATRLREIEARTGRLAPQFGQPARSLEPQIRAAITTANPTGWAPEAVARATRHQRPRPQRSCGELQPITDPLWQA